MNKVFIVFCLSLLPLAFVYAQTEVDTIQTELESDCEANLEVFSRYMTLKENMILLNTYTRKAGKKKYFVF